METTFTKSQLDILKSYSKVCNVLSTDMDRTYLKFADGRMTYFMKGERGAFSINIDVDYTGNPLYLVISLAKWVNALQKFDYADEINVKITRSLMKMWVDGSSDVINLGITPLDEDSSEASIINTFLDRKEQEIVPNGMRLDLTEEILDDFSLTNSLFVAQNSINSIGISPTNILYADRGTVLRAFYKTELPDELFSGLDDDQSYIHIHSYVLSILPLIAKTSPQVFFSKDYYTVYWSDDNARLVIASPTWELKIPTETQIGKIAPRNSKASFTVELGTLRNAINFFNGFYEASTWKPLMFISEANKEVLIRYRHPTTDITKTLDVTCPEDGSFLLDSESLKKVAMRARGDDETPVTFKFDESSLGIFTQFGDDCEVIFSKLIDDSEE